MNQHEYCEKLSKIDGRASYRTIEQLLNYCGYSINPFYNLNDSFSSKTIESINQLGKINIYEYSTNNGYVLKYVTDNHSKLLEFVKSKCNPETLK